MKKFNPFFIAAIGLLFMYAGISKLLDFNNFIVQLDSSPLIPDSLTLIVARGLPILEILIAIGLCFDATRKLCSYLTFAVMLGFTVYLVVLIMFFENVPCSCGGILGKMSYPVHIIFNIVFTAIAGFLCVNADAEN